MVVNFENECAKVQTNHLVIGKWFQAENGFLHFFSHFSTLKI